MKIESLKAELKTTYNLYVDAVERYECKTDALNAALLSLDHAVKENERCKEALLTIATLSRQSNRYLDDYGKIAREALSGTK